MPIGKASRVDVPTLTGSAGALAPADYAIACRLPEADSPGHDAEWWARATFAAIPAVLRPLIRIGWSLGLRLRLAAAGSPDHVLGWVIVDDEPATLTMSAPSPLIEATNTFLVDGTGVTWVTLVRYRTRLGRVLWSTAAPLHQLTMPLLLRRAANAA
jgi:hypothetical protein